MENVTLDKVEATKAAFADERLRWLIGKGDALVQRGDLNNEILSTLLQRTVQEEVDRNLILRAMENGPMTTSEIAKKTEMKPDYVLHNLLALVKWHRANIIGKEQGHYLFRRE
jgi:predicted Rossmann fold nucleotide-binding protein DprA/Smf involved in DNA uptake